MAYCNSCGNKLENNEAFCNKCGASNPMYKSENGSGNIKKLQNMCNNANKNYPTNQINSKKENKKDSALSIWAIILSLFGCTFWIGIILAIIDLNKKDGKRKIGSICALIISAIYIIMFVFNMGNGSNSNRTNNDTSYETVQEVKEELKEEEKQETVKTKEKEESEENEEPQKVTISRSDYTKDCIEYKYKTIARNPDDCIGNKYYGTFEVFSKENGSWYSGYDICYKCFDEENNFIYVIDMQDKDSEDYVNVLEGDTIVVYGTFNGMVESKNYLNNSVSDEVCLNMYFCDLIEE